MDTLNTVKSAQTYRTNHGVRCSPLIEPWTTSKSLLFFANMISNSDRSMIKSNLLQTSSSQPLSHNYNVNPIPAILHGGASSGTSYGLVISTLPLSSFVARHPICFFYTPFWLAAELRTSQPSHSHERENARLCSAGSRKWTWKIWRQWEDVAKDIQTFREKAPISQSKRTLFQVKVQHLKVWIQQQK